MHALIYIGYAFHLHLLSGITRILNLRISYENIVHLIYSMSYIYDGETNANAKNIKYNIKNKIQDYRGN